MAPDTGAKIIARQLRDLGVTVVFGLVGVPVTEIAEEAINLGIRYVGFRNEQAASYAASGYGYLTGRPGVCLLVAGPGVLHGMAGIGNSSANAFPLLVLAGSIESNLVTKGGFQEMDAVSLLTPHTKLAVRAQSLEQVPSFLQNAYRTSWYGRPGASFVDLPADVIQAAAVAGNEISSAPHPEPNAGLVPSPPKPAADPTSLFKITQLLKSAKAPLVVIGKGAAYARAESHIRALISQTQIPFLPTPMGKGVVPDSHPLNAASARSQALKQADVVLLLGARLNWILHYGEEPKWSAGVKFIQVDISAEELGRNTASAELGILGDLTIVVPQLLSLLQGWRYSPQNFSSILEAGKKKNEAAALKKATQKTESEEPMTFERAYHIIRYVFNVLSPPEDGGIVYVSEGANTMDIGRSAFPIQEPRVRLDAGTYATMGVGLGYAIAAYAAYNFPPVTGKKRKIVALEGDSAFGFSAAEIETMARYKMSILIIVMNNSGIYRGDTSDRRVWLQKQRETESGGAGKGGLRSTSLGHEVRYEKMAEMCGGKGYFVRTEEELEKATREGFQNDVVTLINVVIEPGVDRKVDFSWQKTGEAATKRHPRPNL